MNTTEAATKANVTTKTIRTWCRFGAVNATKAHGRWGHRRSLPHPPHRHRRSRPRPPRP